MPRSGASDPRSQVGPETTNATATATRRSIFFGRYVLMAAFVLAIFGWGAGFYGPPVFLSAVVKRTGWSVEFVSGTVTIHFLCGAIVILFLPSLYRRSGVARVTGVGVLTLTAGLLGWALAASPWQLVLAAILTGAGWVTMGAAALNAIVSPWFVRTRPKALSMAYNGASVGGVIMSPLWAVLIFNYSFVLAAIVIAAVMVPTVLIMSYAIFAKTPEQLGQAADDDAPGASGGDAAPPPAEPSSQASLWRNRYFITLAAGMALGLFAQIGLLAHLFSVMAPVLGDEAAGFAMASITAASIAGRFVASRAMSPGADRRVVACMSYALQLVGSLVLVASAGTHIPLLLLGIILFGSGVGNATSLPPLIAQKEFAEGDAQQVISRAIAISQATYSFAPAVFGVLAGVGHLVIHSPVAWAISLFIAAALVQSAAVGSFLIGRRRQLEAT